MATMNVLDAAGATVAVEKPLTPGRAAAASSRPIAVSTEDKAVLDAIAAAAGAINDAAWASGNGTLVALLKAIAGAALDNVTQQPVKVSDDLLVGEYETVAASQTDQVIGASGAANDFFSHLLIIPATTSPGAVSIKDGAGSAITVFTGGASSVTNLVPFVVPLNIKCVTSWKVTTGANVSAIAVGNFT